MGQTEEITAFVEHWAQTGGSELANTQSFINGLCALIGVPQPHGSKADDAGNDYVFERRVFQDNGDDTQSFGRIDCYKRDSFDGVTTHEFEVPLRSRLGKQPREFGWGLELPRLNMSSFCGTADHQEIEQGMRSAYTGASGRLTTCRF